MKSIRTLAVSLGLTSLLVCNTPAVAQSRDGEQPAVEMPDPLQGTGTLAEIQQKGRVTTVVLDMDDGTRHEVKVTPTIQFAVVGPGEKEFLTKGHYVSGQGILSNGTIFLSTVTVHIFPKGRKLPASGFEQIPAAAGESLAAWKFGGELTEVGPSEDYPDYTMLGLKVRGQVPNVWMEKEYSVTVSSAVPGHAPIGAPVEVQFKALRGGKLAPVSIVVTRDEPFTPEEFAGEVVEADSAGNAAAPDADDPAESPDSE